MPNVTEITTARKPTKKQRLFNFLQQRGRQGATGKDLIANVGSDYGTYIHGLRRDGIAVQTLHIFSTATRTNVVHYVLPKDK